MSLAVLALVSILVLFMLGYQFNRSEGTIEQGGLVQFNTTPTGAEVLIDGKNLGARTASRKTMSTGQHFISMQRTGYQAWQKSIDVMPGSVLWLTYARLIPNDLDPVEIADFTSVTSSAAAPDRRKIAIKEVAATPAIQLADISRDDVEVNELALPADSYTAPSEGQAQTFTIEKWHDASRHLLVRHVYDKNKTEWLIVDTENVAETKNVTGLLGVDATKVIFSRDSASVVYALVDKRIRKIDVNERTLSGPLVSNVAEFSLYGRSTIVYKTLLDGDTGKRSIGYYTDGASKSRTLRSYADNGKIPLHVAIGQYFNDYYFAISYDETVEILKGALPRSDVADPSNLKVVSTMTVPGGVRHLSTRTSGRFVVAQTANAYIVHDIELDKTTTTKLKNATPVTEELGWLDGYTLWSDQGGTLRIYEFDGANQHDIMSVSSGHDATYSQNAKYLYGIDQSESGEFHLQRVRMILP